MALFIFRKKLCSICGQNNVVPKEDITLESNIVTIPDDSIYSFAKDTECNSQLASDLRRAEDDECRIQQLEDDDPTYSSTNETLSKSQRASARPDIAACVPPSTLKVDGEYSYSVVNKCKIFRNTFRFLLCPSKIILTYISNAKFGIDINAHC
ncbi:uncharacterized protein LOC127864148 [Dreissena polymorpha]|uniref:uncharacterized protein LOC127864148 n=1 Tax=Dreissena polymorpha TaxID=45954 RepID=UPI002263DFB4|nr:uncharacterized protein LOC127864148 [Dreissena polymorpha]